MGLVVVGGGGGGGNKAIATAQPISFLVLYY